MQRGKIGGYIWFLPIRDTAARGAGMTNLAYIRRWNMRDRLGGCSNTGDMTRHALVDQGKHGVHT